MTRHDRDIMPYFKCFQNAGDSWEVQRGARTKPTKLLYIWNKFLPTLEDTPSTFKNRNDFWVHYWLQTRWAALGQTPGNTIWCTEIPLLMSLVIKPLFTLSSVEFTCCPTSTHSLGEWVLVREFPERVLTPPSQPISRPSLFHPL